MELKTLENLNNLIENKIEESSTLDYKRELDKNNEEIAKDISAFANTVGGTIIYGITEEKGVPVGLNWVENRNVKERIESIVLSSIQPKLEVYEIFSIQKPDDAARAIFVVNVPESFKAPHMAKHQYYKRYNFQSMPMEDHEVKEVMFKRGLRRGLEFEMSENLRLAKRTWELIDKIYAYRPEQVKTTVFTPFYSEAWKALVSSGLLYVLKENSLELIRAYSLIHEINHLIDCQKHGLGIIVTPSAPDTLPDHGKWIPSLIRDKIQALCPILDKLGKEI